MDQATELRQLMRRDAPHLRSAPGDAPHVVAVASGKKGVGTTTVAVNLAATLARLGRRVVLVDADLEGADVGGLIATSSEHGIADVLRGSRDVHEVLCRAPGGFHVLPGIALGESADCTPKAQERLIASLRRLGPHADDIVLDVGCGARRVHRRFWHAADKVVAVVAPDDAAVMNVYAAIKLAAEGDTQLPIFSLVNFAADALAAQAAHERLAQACRRFLDRHLFAGGRLPAAQEVRDAARSRQPFALAAPACEAALDLEQAAQALITPQSDPPAPKMWERLWQRHSVGDSRQSRGESKMH